MDCLAHLNARKQRVPLMSNRKSVPLRISHSLYEQLQRMAEQELRSVNGQIEFLLTQAVRKQGRSVSPSPNPANHQKPPPVDPSEADDAEG